MHRILRLCLPPIFLIMISRFTRILKQMSARSSKVSEYQDDDLIRMVVQKNFINRKTLSVNKVIDLSAMRSMVGFGIGEFKPSALKVLDFGGGGGFHHDIFELAYHDRTHIWCVVETPSMVTAAKKLETNCLHFRSDILAARKLLGGVDFVFASSSLQYTTEPLSYLKKLLDVNAKYLVITRTVFNEKDTTITFLQHSRLSENGPGPLPEGFNNKTISYPVTVVSKNEVEKLIKEKYNIRFSTLEDKSINHTQGVALNQYGYFCERKAF